MAGRQRPPGRGRRGAGHDDELLRPLWREQNRPPRSLARRLGAGDFALWSDAAGARWHLSTGDLTVVLGGPETTDIRVGNIAPARGGGSASIDVGGWSVRCAHDSRSIEGAAQALGRIPGVTVSRYSGSDA